jgi:hypothetical protein
MKATIGRLDLPMPSEECVSGRLRRQCRIAAAISRCDVETIW